MSVAQFIQRIVSRFDSFQQKHAWLGFPLAVVKKYGDDTAGNHGAIITYFAFLALFPLLFALNAALQLLFRHSPHLQATILKDVDSFFPLLGSELQHNIKVTNVGKTSLTLLASALLALYGARGVADATRGTLDHLWGVPKARRAGFPLNMLKSLSMIVVGGAMVIGSAVLSNFATSLGHSIEFKIFSTLVSLTLLVVSLFVLMRIGISARDEAGTSLVWSALFAGVGLQILQTYGGYLMTHELKRLNTPYGAFSVALALLFWLYLQAEVVLYAIEASVVHHRRLWPRAIVGEAPPAAKTSKSKK